MNEPRKKRNILVVDCGKPDLSDSCFCHDRQFGYFGGIQGSLKMGKEAGLGGLDHFDLE